MNRKKKVGLVPFANEADVAAVGNLSFENRLDRITISGDIDLTLDKAGLAQARALHALLGSIVDAMAARELPDTLPPPQVGEIDNPFR